MPVKNAFRFSLSLAAIIALSACNNSATMEHTVSSQSPVIHPPTALHNTHPAWSYTGNTGPVFWGDLDGNEACKIGNEQSPINIQKVIKSTGSAPQPNFTNSDIDILNNGHTVVFTPTNDNNTSIIDGETYTLKQFHYHTPSEHQVSGLNYPAELHFVHANSRGNLAVIGVMLNPTATNNTNMYSLVNASVGATKRHQATHLQNVPLSTFLPTDTQFYNYNGSLTTPPCSEQVKWFVASKPLSVTQEELFILKQLYSNNNRPIQPLEDREIKFIP